MADTVTTAVEAITQRFEAAKKNVEGFYGRFRVDVQETRSSKIHRGLLEMAINWYLEDLNFKQLLDLCRDCLTYEDPSDGDDVNDIVTGIIVWSFTHIVRTISYSMMEVDEEKNTLKIKMGEEEYLTYSVTTDGSDVKCSSSIREKISDSNFSSEAKEFFLQNIDTLFYLFAKSEPCEEK